MKTFQVGELTIVGPCADECCRNSPAGTTVQIQDDEGSISIPIQDIDAFVLALLALRSAGRLAR